jgi:16S rRNA (guanine527-N7)-methyltransferase
VDVITARALASMPSLAGLMAPFFNPSTIALLHKGRDWQEELTQAQQYWKLETIAHESRTDADARLIEVRALAAR